MICLSLGWPLFTGLTVWKSEEYQLILHIGICCVIETTFSKQEINVTIYNHLTIIFEWLQF